MYSDANTEHWFTQHHNTAIPRLFLTHGTFSIALSDKTFRFPNITTSIDVYIMAYNRGDVRQKMVMVAIKTCSEEVHESSTYVYGLTWTNGANKMHIYVRFPKLSESKYSRLLAH